VWYCGFFHDFRTVRRCGIVASFMILELSRKCCIVSSFMIVELFRKCGIVATFMVSFIEGCC
jgi:hypothetical protein